MTYADYDTKIGTKEDLEKYKLIFEEDIANKQKELAAFIERAEKRLEELKKHEAEKKYAVLGRCYKDDKKNCILLIIQYKDGTQRDERYSFSEIPDMHDKIEELKCKYSGVDWSDFEYDI